MKRLFGCGYFQQEDDAWGVTMQIGEYPRGGNSRPRSLSERNFLLPTFFVLP